MRGGEQHAAGAAAGQRLRVESMLVDGHRYRVQAPALGGAAVVGVSGVLECDCADALLREYVRACFCPMDDAVRPLVERGVLPLATYVLPDGTPMVPADHAALLRDAGNDADAVAAQFRSRFIAAGGDARAVDEEHAAWLSGEYGACLHATTPEAIVAKSALMTAITALLADPVAKDESWRVALRSAVDALDAIERPFARYDRERFGGPSSRNRLITATRDRFPHLWP
jgi:hypothetical protein